MLWVFKNNETNTKTWPWKIKQREPVQSRFSSDLDLKIRVFVWKVLRLMSRSTLELVLKCSIKCHYHVSTRMCALRNSSQLIISVLSAWLGGTDYWSPNWTFWHWLTMLRFDVTHWRTVCTRARVRIRHVRPIVYLSVPSLFDQKQFWYKPLCAKLQTPLQHSTRSVLT